MLRIPRPIYDQALAHVLALVPAEGVGMFGGTPDGHVHHHIPLPNVAGPSCFLVEPYAQFRALRDLAARDLVPLAVYHSHPRGGSQMSPEDQRAAAGQPYLQVIFAVARRRRPDVAAAYRVSGSVVERVEIEIVGP